MPRRKRRNGDEADAEVLAKGLVCKAARALPPNEPCLAKRLFPNRSNKTSIDFIYIYIGLKTLCIRLRSSRLALTFLALDASSWQLNEFVKLLDVWQR